MASSSSPAAAVTDHASVSSHSPRPSRYPWSHVVRAPAADPDAAPSSPPPMPVIPPPEPADDDAASHPARPHPSDGHDQGGVRKGNRPGTRGKNVAAWKQPSNGSIEAGHVMGAASWPALAESAKASPKSLPSSDALKPLVDESPSASSIEPLIANPSRETDSTNFVPSPTWNHAAPVRQRSMKRGGGSSGSSSGAAANGGLPQPVILGKQAVAPEVFPRDRSTRNLTNWVGRSGPHPDHAGTSDHHRGHGSNHRRGNNGGGPHHDRRNQERGGFDAYYNRGMGGRESHMQQRGARPYFRAPTPVTAPFMSPVPPLQAYANSVVYPDVHSPVIYVVPQTPPESFRLLPFVSQPAAPPTVLFPAMDSQRAALLKQIEYYFSSENLCKDIYLRQNMDEHGWVPITLIAGFNRVKQLTDNIHYILETVRLSTLLEVQGDKIRKRFDWINWVLPAKNCQFVSISGQQYPPMLEFDNLAERLQSIGLGVSNNQNMMISNYGELSLTRSGSGYLNKQLQVLGGVNGEGNGKVMGNMNSDGSKHGKTFTRNDTF